MESLSQSLSTFPPLLNHSRTLISKPRFTSTRKFTSHCLNSLQTHATKPPNLPPFLRFRHISLNPHLFSLCTALSFPLSCFASETAVPTEEASAKINLEAILVSIDEFFNRYPFFVAGVTFIWLVVIPLTEEYLQKYKFISAINAFKKLRDEPSCELLDIRDKRSLAYLGSPNLKILKKSALQVHFVEGNEETFVKEVLESFREPENTTVCIVDNFDGNSLKVAELLVKNGFKEAYAIRGGLRGNKGWQEIQESLLPLSVRVYPKKKAKVSEQQGNGGQPDEDMDSSVKRSEEITNGSVSKPVQPTSQTRSAARPLSPYPNYPDLKPPSSPTPSKPSS
nr:rhodanese-like domain-containing protein 4A, chloroplastic [Ipomoea batatas]